MDSGVRARDSIIRPMRAKAMDFNMAGLTPSINGREREWLIMR